jgi:uncharacterized membrane protein YphA (DoxX/SURF4 family)
MNVVLWIVAGLLALAFVAAGLTKLGWVEDFSPASVKGIGAVEVLAAIGLILPAALGVVPVLVPLAALGLVALMAGAAVTHARRKETPMIAINLVLLVLAVVVAWGRFGPWSFTA